MSFGQRLKDARTARGLRRNALAHLAGVDSSTITRWERDERQATGVLVTKLASALRVSEHWLLTGEGSRVPHDLPEEVSLPPLGKIALEHVLQAYSWPDLPMDDVLEIVATVRAEAMRLEHVDVPESAWRLRIDQLVRDRARRVSSHPRVATGRK